jgi:hypothetical protein
MYLLPICGFLRVLDPPEAFGTSAGRFVRTTLGSFRGPRGSCGASDPCRPAGRRAGRDPGERSRAPIYAYRRLSSFSGPAGLRSPARSGHPDDRPGRTRPGRPGLFEPFPFLVGHDHPQDPLPTLHAGSPPPAGGEAFAELPNQSQESRVPDPHRVRPEGSSRSDGAGGLRLQVLIGPNESASIL